MVSTEVTTGYAVRVARPRVGRVRRGVHSDRFVPIGSSPSVRPGVWSAAAARYRGFGIGGTDVRIRLMVSFDETKSHAALRAGAAECLRRLGIFGRVPPEEGAHYVVAGRAE